MSVKLSNYHLFSSVKLIVVILMLSVYLFTPSLSHAMKTGNCYMKFFMIAPIYIILCMRILE